MLTLLSVELVLVVYTVVISSGMLEEEQNLSLDIKALYSNSTFMIVLISTLGMISVQLLHLGISHLKLRPYIFQKLLIFEMEDDFRDLSARQTEEKQREKSSNMKIKVKYPLFLVRLR